MTKFRVTVKISNSLGFSELIRSYDNERLKPVKQDSGREWIKKIMNKYSK